MRIFNRFFAITGLSFALCIWHGATFAQQADIELLENETPAGWITLAQGEKPDTTNIIISSGNTVMLDVNAAIKNLIIEQNATLSAPTSASNADLYTLEPGTFTEAGPAVISNNGTFGSADGQNSAIALLIPSSCNKFTLDGTGQTGIALIRPKKSNNNLDIDLLQDVNLYYNGVALSAVPLDQTGLTADNITLNILYGKKVAIKHADGEFHGLGTATEGGHYLYDISGMLDLSATTAIQNIVPFTNDASAVDLTIGGTVIFGKQLNLVRPNTQSTGRLSLSILDGAFADATLTTALNPGKAFFATNGSGVLKRTVNADAVTFPVGVSTATPVTLSSAGNAGVFFVGVKNQPDVNLPDADKTVKKQWTIISQNNFGNEVGISTTWLTADQPSTFDASKPVQFIRYANNDWITTDATLSGTGSQADPYRATAEGFTSFGIFAVQNKKVIESQPVVNLYPNPTNGNLNITFPETAAAGNLIITSSEGKKIMQAAIDKGTTNWNANITTWKPGMYFVMMENGGKRSSLKFIKK
ncbi:T9SS type A sorting domain-containing protein [Mucilaginibacter limnophilus]|uniref:T9SS type A sorting domain-containing protein n=1 Tax=Mucilaginibacter limnophilus TaxID=1932778 RepID=A0A3S2UZH7_9SPHI|nr:T9SS type A sorting domain-containing protein [Mucilaginibacter limnophilus]RVT96561.1 T9SS type A sorting domain-containing protein [Mucilaginibacter limnophilus]